MGNAFTSFIPFNNEITNVLKSADNLMFSLRCVSYCSIFGSAVGVASGLYKTISDVKAQKYLMKLGGEISQSVGAIQDSVGVMANHMDQSSFAKHVSDFAAMHINDFRQIASSTTPPRYYFVYHPGTDWHLAFDSLNRVSPLGLCGISSDIGHLAAFLGHFRDIVGPEAVIHILVPAAHIFVVPDALDIPQKLLPLNISGELHRSHKPYVYLSLVNHSAIGIEGVGLMNVSAAGASPGEAGQRVVGARRKWIFSRGAAVGAGGAAGGTTALIAGGIGGALLGPVGALAGVSLAGWVGAKTGIKTRDKVESMLPFSQEGTT
jgi:hypothetical protein